ncbi:MAG TPA: hypothetical protein VNM48_01550 [Chloroflexota bacterium]|nr:hypothetical protein [Chloroflexota bacterium]
MARYILVWLRVTGALAVGAALLTTIWLVRAGDLNLLSFVVSGAAAVAVYLFSTRPPPRPWIESDDLPR